MKRFFPMSLAIVVLFFASSFAQDPKLIPRSTDDTPREANKPSPSQQDKINEYPALPDALAKAVFERADGTKSKLTDYKGKVLLVNLWGIWVGPSRDDLPHIQSWFNSYREKGLEVMALNVGDHNGLPVSRRTIKKFAKRISVTFPLGIASASFIKELYRLSKQQVVPQTILIDRDGRLRAIFVGAGQRNYDLTAAMLEKVMAE